MHPFKKIISIIVLLFGSIGFNSLDAQTTYYVNDGMDGDEVYTTAAGTPGGPGTAGAPYSSLTALLAGVTLAPGDIILIDAGFYIDENIFKSGGCVDNLTIIGAGSSLTQFENVSGGTQEKFMYIQCDNFTLKDLSATNYRYDGGDESQAIDISNAQNVVLEGVLAFGNLGSGGDAAIGIGSNATVTIRNASSSCNKIGGAYSGGIIVKGTNSTVNIDNLVIAQNSRSGFNGAGVEIVGTGAENAANVVVNISNSIIEDNHGIRGGGLFVYNATVNISNTCFIGNTSSEAGRPAGGAIVARDHSTVTITDSRFIGNEATNSAGDGGAISVYGHDINVTITGSYFEGNSADDGQAIHSDKYGTGGGVSVTINQTIFASGQTLFQTSDGNITANNSGAMGTLTEGGSVSGNGSAQTAGMPPECVTVVDDCNSCSDPVICKLGLAPGDTILKSEDETTILMYFDEGTIPSVDITAAGGLQSNSITSGFGDLFQVIKQGSVCNSGFKTYLADIEVCCVEPILAVTKIDEMCTGTNYGSIDLTITGSATYEIDWDNDGTNDFDDTEDLSNLPDGTYTVVVRDQANVTCSDTTSVTITNCSNCDAIMGTWD